MSFLNRLCYNKDKMVLQKNPNKRQAIHLIYGNVELFNVAEAVAVPGRAGVLLQRIPESVRSRLRDASQRQYRQASGVELRFVNERGPAQITLASYRGSVQAYLYFGNFAAGSFTVTEEPTAIECALPSPHFLFRDDFHGSDYPFSPRVVRLLFKGGEVHLLKAQGEGLRPPLPSELPKLRYMAYGTSITQGDASGLSYVNQTAWRLLADALNLGASGTAYCEPELADYMAKRDDWNIASLCISVNMLNQGVSGEEFQAKARYMVRTIAERNPDKPLVCIGLFPSFHDLGYSWPNRIHASTADEYRSILRDIAADPLLQNTHYIDGQELLTSFNGLSHDLLHPSDQGMIEIGEHLAKFMRKLICRSM
ncbi:hypothetical protein FE784_03645 [Paenibacillus hemerocallicola]|uniref:SGNH hydrolase-type esterase domain-containing protein n=2 Tax=Paenibacillus hemerocallicola TaxID=1172614 RepID=A0A5C4TH93_9BACL|nr:hypothetical protein FE784_03645 [Paenibacillus hemerocallicola]